MAENIVSFDPELKPDRFNFKIEPLTEEEVESATDERESKGLSPDLKRAHWEVYAQKTARQEIIFKRVFDDIFKEQRELIIDNIRRTGELLGGLDDDKTAQKFQPAIELVYESSFQDAV